MQIDIAGMRVPEPHPEVGPQDAPPSDAAAECALLAMCLIYPDRVASLHLDGLLVFPEHRTIWRAMRKAVFFEPEVNVADFWLAVKAEVGYPTLRVLDFGEHANPKDIVYWLGRLERVREARRLISDAQEQAEKAWRLDVIGARRVAARTAARAAEQVRPEVEIPV